MNYNRLEYDSNLTDYYGWRSQTLPNILSRVPRQDFSEYDLFLFGVFGGKSTIEWCRMLNDLNLIPKTIVCFDSFEGIPLETAEPVQDGWNPRKSGFFKAFNAKEYFDTEDVASAVEIFQDRIEPFLPKGTSLKVIPGFFNKSLTNELAQTLNQSIFVDIDVDIYSSTKEVLNWMATNDLFVNGKTLIGYDDWGGTPGYMSMTDGESRAHREIQEEFNLRWEEVVRTGNMEQVVFQLLD